MLVLHFAPDLSLLWFYCLADQLTWSYRPQCVWCCCFFPVMKLGGYIKVVVSVCYYHQDQGHSEGLRNQNMTVFTIILFSGLMNLLLPSIGI